MRRTATWLPLLLLLALGSIAYAQQSDTREPEQYGEEEFSQAARDLRRAEIILFGSFPLTLFLSLEAYDFFRFADSGWDVAYAPWPLRPPAPAGYQEEESIGVLVAALSLSAALAIADYAIGRIRERRAQDPDRRRR